MAVPLREAVALSQHAAPKLVRFQHPAAPIEMKDTQTSSVQQSGQGIAARAGGGQRLPHAHEVRDMGHQPFDSLHVLERPATAVHRPAEAPEDVRATVAANTYIQLIVAAEPRDEAGING